MLILANITGWIVAHWRIVAIVAGLVLVLILALSIKSCLTPKPKLDEVEIQRAEQAVKDRNDKELINILTNSDVRERQIEANIANARVETQQAVQEAHEKYKDMTTDELAAELEKRR